MLIVEDDYQLARDVGRELERLGAAVRGLAPSVAYARRLLDHPGRIDGAFLDVALHGEDVYQLASKLCGLGIPILFMTNLDAATLPMEFRDVPHLGKPVTRHRLAAAIHYLRRARSSGSVAGGVPPPPVVPWHSSADRFAAAVAKALRG